MKLIAVLALTCASAAFGATLDNNFFNYNASNPLSPPGGWTITYQPTNAVAPVAQSWVEAWLIFPQAKTSVTPFSDALPNTQSTCAAFWIFIDDTPYNSDRTSDGQVWITSSCTLASGGVAVGSRKVVLRVKANTITTLNGSFRSDSFDINGVLLLTLTGTVTGTAMQFYPFAIADFSALPSP